MASKRASDIEAFLKEVEAESRAAGSAEDLGAYREHFRLARELISMRRARGWTQQELASASGVQQSEISRIERGQGNPTFRTLLALAHSASMRVAFVSARTARRPHRKPRR